MPVTKTIKILLSNGKTLIVGNSFFGSQYQKSQYPNVVKRGKEYVQEFPESLSTVEGLTGV